MSTSWDNRWPIKGANPTWSLADGSLVAFDHLGGFDSNFKNTYLENLAPGVIHTEYHLSDAIKALYPHLTIKFDSQLTAEHNFFSKFVGCAVPPEKSFANFLCCFNRSGHMSRQWLCHQLHVLNWFNPEYCSKNFVMHAETTDSSTQKFCQTIVTFGDEDRPQDHQYNRQVLDHKIQQSFLHLVSETVGESFVPFVTEKILYPIVNKTLWVTYAQPGYHAAVQKLLGFKTHRCFDFSFDQITDPMERLTALTDMLAPFSAMAPAEWQDIYQQEADILEFNFEHCRSGNFIKHLHQFNESDRHKLKHIA